MLRDHIAVSFDIAKIANSACEEALRILSVEGEVDSTLLGPQGTRHNLGIRVCIGGPVSWLRSNVAASIRLGPVSHEMAVALHLRCESSVYGRKLNVHTAFGASISMLHVVELQGRSSV